MTVCITLSIVLILGATTGAYFYWQLRERALTLESKNKELQNLVATTSSTLASTTLLLKTEAAKNNALSSQMESIALTVNNLDKLSKTDRELLKKYSKVSFLNEHYVPGNLATITPAFLSNHEAQRVHIGVWPHLERMLQTASSSGLALQVNSAYRSFGTQAKIKSNYVLTYGSGANKFSADQGYSEHQLGTTVDFSTPSVKGAESKFGKTPEFNWLKSNAYKYGFILSYPENNTYYQYEPWHWRFVGVALATKLSEEGKYFYIYPQRLIDSYLISIFD